MAATTLLTIEDFERLPGAIAENHELVDGELVDVSGNTPVHNNLRDYLIELLRPFARDRRIGSVISEQEYDFEGNAHGPDISFFGSAKRGLLDPRRRVQPFVPDLAIEIASESDGYESLMRKKDRYLTAGVSEVWLISMESREIAVYTKAFTKILRSADTASTELLPGFSIGVEALFQGQ
jgi:Uma2 family endonuclease